MAYIFLVLTIISEIVGAISTRYSDGFRKRVPSIVTVVAIIASYYFFAISLIHGMNIGIGYTIWSGLGVTCVALYGIVVFKESLTKVQILGIAFIIAGVACLQL